MTNQDRKQFAQLCALLSQAFDKEMGELLINIYFDALKDFSIEQVASAVNQAVRGRKYFPKVAELRELVEGSADDRAAQAWAAFLQAVADGGQASVQFASAATAAAMDAVFGGWLQACRTLSADCSDEMLAHYQKAFLRQYAAATHNAQHVELYRPGLSEMSLREGGGAWAARMPTLEQPVLYVGTDKAYTLRMRFDVAQGRLTDEDRRVLDGGWLAIQPMVAGEHRRLKRAEEQSRKALSPAPKPGEEMATPEEVAELKARASQIAPSQRNGLALVKPTRGE